MIEPLSCAVHGMNRLGAVSGRRALVIGAGTMGLLMGQLLAHAGASEVALVDRSTARLDLARRMGFGLTAPDARELPEGGFDVAVDATGVPAAIEAAFDALRRGGSLLVFGVADAAARIELSPFRIYNDEIRVLGSMAVLHSFADAVGLIGTAVDVSPLLGDGYDLDGFADAVQAVRTGSGPGTKVHIAPNNAPT